MRISEFDNERLLSEGFLDNIKNKVQGLVQAGQAKYQDIQNDKTIKMVGKEASRIWSQKARALATAARTANVQLTPQQYKQQLIAYVKQYVIRSKVAALPPQLLTQFNTLINQIVAQSNNPAAQQPAWNGLVSIGMLMPSQQPNQNQQGQTGQGQGQGQQGQGQGQGTGNP